MTPKEKAKELVEKMYSVRPMVSARLEGTDIKQKYYGNAKRYALLAVGEILDTQNKILLPRKFWEEVKEEIQKL